MAADSRRAALPRRTVLSSAAAAGFTLPAASRANAASAQACSEHTQGRLYPIGAGRHRAVVSSVAATLLSWRIDGVETLLTYAPDEVGAGYNGKTILPWPNRIDHGRYTVGGTALQVPINEPENDAALHGLMTFTEWRSVMHTNNRVVLEHLLHPQYGYPFMLLFRSEFTVDKQGVHNRLTAHNLGERAAPFGTATHPYFAAGSGGTDDVNLTLPADTYYRVNDRLIPTGKSAVDGTEYDFRDGHRVGQTRMDTAFTGILRQPGGTATVRIGRSDMPDLDLRLDPAHDYLQVYTDDSPGTDRPPRQAIVVEPASCPPDAFNTGDGLVMLAPGQRWQGRYSVLAR